MCQPQIALFKEKYPGTVFSEIKGKSDLNKLTQKLTATT
jgi:hypothetical protein